MADTYWSEFLADFDRRTSRDDHREPGYLRFTPIEPPELPRCPVCRWRGLLPHEEELGRCEPCETERIAAYPYETEADQLGLGMFEVAS